MDAVVIIIRPLVSLVKVAVSIEGLIKLGSQSDANLLYQFLQEGVSSALISYSLEKPTLHCLYDVCITSLGDYFTLYIARHPQLAQSCCTTDVLLEVHMLAYLKMP